MLRQIRSGILDLIGAARPSIADPFLPKKIEEGRFEEIRECIGCNICVAGDFQMVPSRCTQNPSMGEEWRRGWHPERIRKRRSEAKVLVVGAGPAGLEATMMLGRRGYEVALAEKGKQLGGRVALERGLPGLSAWGRVADYRMTQLAAMTNVEIYRDSDLTADDVLGFGFAHVAIATGSRWRDDGVGRRLLKPLPCAEGADILTPDDLLAGRRPAGKSVLIYDDDHYYMGGVLAELLVREGFGVTLVTPAPDVSNWMRMTMEQFRVQARLLELGVRILAQTGIASIGRDRVETVCVFTDRREMLAAESTVLVTARWPNNELSAALQARKPEWADAGILSVATIGDALAPGIIAAAVFAGRRYAEELEEPRDENALSFRREVTGLVTGPLPWQSA
jgi:dimethylamine/trimethylamine dehydrogenase